MSLDSSYQARTHHLAVGFEPRDELLGGRPRWPVRLDIEFPDGVPRRVANGYRHFSRPGDLVPGINRHDSGLYKLVFLERRDLPADAVVRIYDDLQRFVPRRLRFSIPARQDTWLDGRPRPSRRQAPLLLPANAYPVAERVMALRGRIRRGGQPMPWAWVHAFYLVAVGDPNNPQFLRRGQIGRAVSDHDGEFLLVLRPLPRSGDSIPALESPVWVNVVINGPSPAPAEPAGNSDPLWAVPVEQLPAPGGDDPASDPGYVPPGYATDLGPGANRNIEFIPGRTLTGIDVADFEFVLP